MQHILCTERKSIWYVDNMSILILCSWQHEAKESKVGNNTGAMSQ